jgi:2-methylcitrate dehydratase PrpD
MNAQLLSVLEWLDAVVLDREPAVQTHARWLVLDTLGCVVAGRRAGPVAEFEQRAALADPGSFYFSIESEPASLGLSNPNAAMMLAMAACWDEACEGHAGAHGRPGVAVFAALLPMSSRLTYGQFLKSFVVGYEIGARFGASLRIKKGMHVDGNWPALGAAAAVAHALGLGPVKIAQAVQMAACQLPMSLYLPVRSGDTSRNTYLGHSAQLGQSAALAVACGITAPSDAVLEYAQVGLSQAPGAFDSTQRFHILQGYFKTYAAVRHVHYGALAAHALRNVVDLGKVTGISLQIYEEATVYCGNRAPQTPIQAQFSLTFGVAATLRWGRLDPWVYREPQFQDPLLRALEAKVKVSVDAQWTQQQMRGARLLLECSDGTHHEKEITAVPGDVQMPFTEPELADKFLSYCVGSMTAEIALNWAHLLLGGSADAHPFPFWNSPTENRPC